MKVKVVLVFLSILSVGYVFAQRKNVADTSTLINQPNRVEFDLADYGMSYHVIGGEYDGLLVVQETENRAEDGYNWSFYSLDTTLSERWTRILSIGYDSHLLGTEYHDGKYYLLFNASRYHSEDLILYEIDAETGDHEKMEINTVFPVQLTFFEVLGSNVIFGGYTNYRPVLLTFDLEEKKPRVVPGFYDNNSDIIDIIIDDDAEMFTVIQQERMRNRKYTIRTKTFTSSGDIIQSNFVQPGEKKNLIDGASTTFYGGFQYVAGTYSKKATQYSKGLYLAKFVNGRQQFVKYHDYSDLDNFFGFMNDRREQRIKDRIARKKSKGKKAQFSYRLVVHDMIQRDGQYLLIAEAYYPRYSTYSSGFYNYGWGGSSRYNPNFMGYKYTHAVVVAFDRNGNIIWDNSFEVNDVESYSLDEFVVVSNYDDKTVLMYLEENEIRSKVIQGNEIIEGKTFSPVKLAFTEDEVKNRNPEVEGLKPWFGRTMYAFGEQRIRNEAGAGGRINRMVFYINKIQYHLENKAN